MPSSSTTSPRDHPRSRGVYDNEASESGVCDGSSPLARGLLGEKVTALQNERIIPARAGFTGLIALNRANFKDHPRSRGVYHVGRRPGIVEPGSSPLARGLRAAQHPLQDAVRIIPARAGFTVNWSVRASCPQDHPRSRGVYRRDHGLPKFAHGSSPLARGLPGNPLEVAPESRIIPARAGFTASCRCACRPTPDHPRSRGVYMIHWGNQLSVEGSSPLARGLPPRGGR